MRDYDKESNRLHTCTTKTLDEVYRSIFKLGYAQAEKDTINRAVEWLCTHHPFDTKEQAELYAAAFKKAMEKEEE